LRRKKTDAMIMNTFSTFNPMTSGQPQNQVDSGVAVERATCDHKSEAVIS